VLLKDNVTALNDLELGGVDGVVLDSVVANYSIAQSKKPLIIVGEALATESYGVDFRKNDVLLRDEVQRILEDMQNDGTVKAISEKWFGTDISVIGK
ncbi:MAG: transporter substrate-binding domain-containing protein, partial [Treponema sp.]|nr:transporter substrate-binding domain-containing protein [Treponema sp.]